MKKKYEKQNRKFWGVFKQLNLYSAALLLKKELVVNFCIQFNLYSLIAVEANELYCTEYFVLSPSILQSNFQFIHFYCSVED